MDSVIRHLSTDPTILALNWVDIANRVFVDNINISVLGNHTISSVN